jgi:hypothetical protein
MYVNIHVYKQAIFIKIPYKITKIYFKIRNFITMITQFIIYNKIENLISSRMYFNRTHKIKK